MDETPRRQIEARPKIYITEYTIETGCYAGPYILARSWEEAEAIAAQHGCIVKGELVAWIEWDGI